MGLAVRGQRAYFFIMDGAPHLQDDPPDRSETAEKRQRRLAREDAMIDQALASAAAGRTVSFAAVKAWVDSWDTDQELPRLRSGHETVHFLGAWPVLPTSQAAETKETANDWGRG